MKKTIFIMCFAIILTFFSGCMRTDEVAQTEEMTVSAETVYHPEIRAQSNIRQGSFVELESGCYYQSGEWIYFIPRGEDQSYPLCSKPNCTHEDSNCNAYCGWAFGYYDGFLYGITINVGVNLEYSLIRMNLDGTEHKTVCESDMGKATSAEFTFHDGKIFISIWGDSTILEEARDRLVMIDLADYTQTELFEDYFADGSRMVIQQLFDNKIYGYSDNYMTRGENCNILEWNITTGNVRQVVEGIIPGGYVTETTFYYLEPDVGFCEFDFATRETKNCGLPVDDAWWATYDEDFIYLMGHGRNDDADHTLYFLNWDYELLDQIELTDDIYYGYVASDRFYFVDNADYERTSITHYIDKANIGSGELTLQPFG